VKKRGRKPGRRVKFKIFLLRDYIPRKIFDKEKNEKKKKDGKGFDIPKVKRKQKKKSPSETSWENAKKERQKQPVL